MVSVAAAGSDGWDLFHWAQRDVTEAWTPEPGVWARAVGEEVPVQPVHITAPQSRSLGFDVDSLRRAA